MVFCNKCGKPLDGDDAFCPACGAKRTVEPAPAEPAPVFSPAPAQSESPTAVRALRFSPQSKFPLAAAIAAGVFELFALLQTYRAFLNGWEPSIFRILIGSAASVLFIIFAPVFAKKKPLWMLLPLGLQFVFSDLVQLMDPRGGYISRGGTWVPLALLAAACAAIFPLVYGLAITGKLKSKGFVIASVFFNPLGHIILLTVGGIVYGAGMPEVASLLSLLLGSIPNLLLVLGFAPSTSRPKREGYASAPAQPTQIPQPGQPYAPEPEVDKTPKKSKAPAIVIGGLVAAIVLVSVIAAAVGGNRLTADTGMVYTTTSSRTAAPAYEANDNYDNNNYNYTTARTPDIVGTWTKSSGGLFDVGAITCYSGGTMEISMDHIYTGTYSKSGSQITFTITGGKSSVSTALAKRQNGMYKITAELNSDDTLTVYIKAKSGYIYYGNESATFKRW